MKLRCTHNSIRLRLRKSDIHSLKTFSSVNESVYLGHHKAFSFSLSLNEKIEEVSVNYVDHKIDIQVPSDQGLHWIESSEVGIEVKKKFEEGNELHILIEKDFPCLDRENEDKADTFWELSRQEAPKNC